MKNRPLLVIFLTVFMDLVGFGIIIPLSPYLARVYGATPFQVGLLMALYSGMQFLFAPFWGRLSDQHGRRPILLLTILGTATGHLMFFFAGNLLVLFLARALAGFFGGNLSTAMAYIADVTKPEERSKGMGLFGAAFGLGFIFGPAIAGYVSTFGESLPALVASLISTINFVWAFFALRESLPEEKRKIVERGGRIRKLYARFSRPTVGPLLLIHLFISVAMANMEASLFLLVQDRLGFTMKLASYGFAYIGLCMVFTQGYLIRKILPKFGERNLLPLGLLGFAVGMMGVGFSYSAAAVAVAMTSFALGNGLYMPSLNGSLSLLTPSDEQGEVLGAGQSIAALGRIIGPPIGGYIYQLNNGSPFFAASLLGVVAFSLAIFVRPKIPNAGKAQGHFGH